jgi:putative aldouronate transport system substrate-binding protein
VWSDLILNNPEGMTVTQALTKYTGSDQGTSKRQQTMYTDYQLAAVTAWTTDVDGAYVLPDLTLSADDSAEASALLGDIRTHISEASLKFVVGERSLSEFEDFRTELKDMGIERVIEIYQEAYNSYMED